MKRRKIRTIRAMRVRRLVAKGGEVKWRVLVN